MSRWLALFCLMGVLLFAAGCSKSSQTPPADNGNSNAPMSDQQQTGQPQTGGSSMQGMPSGMPMMKEDPNSISQVTGEIQEANQNEIIVFTTKGVTLRFGLTKDTKIDPAGAKLAPGAKVTVHIQHVSQGMNAGEVDVSK